jgi:hypothetical protein
VGHSGSFSAIRAISAVVFILQMVVLIAIHLSKKAQS